MICKCKREEEYWNAIGNSKIGYFTRKNMTWQLFIHSIPGFGFILFITGLFFGIFESGTKKRVPKKYRLPKDTSQENQEK